MATTKLGATGAAPVPAAEPTAPEKFFGDRPDGMAIYAAVHALLAALGPVEVRVSRSQVAFRRGRGFAYLWRPGRWLRSPSTDVVLSIALDHAVAAPRIKEVVHPAPAVWMHHVELHGVADVDDEVAGWLAEAYREATPRPDHRRGRRSVRRVGGVSPWSA